METWIFLINFEATFEKLRTKYELFTEKLWGNVRLTFEKLQMWKIAWKSLEIMKKFGKALKTAAEKYWKYVQEREQKTKNFMYRYFPKKLGNIFPEILRKFLRILK